MSSVPKTQYDNRNPSEDLGSVFGLSIHSAVYAFMLILANLSAFFSFLIMSQAHFTVDYVIQNTNTTDTVSMSYQDFAGLEFSMVVSVTEWIWTVGLLTIMVSVTFMEAWKLSPAMKTFVYRGNIVAGAFLYTSLIACSSVSGNCFENNHSGIDNYNDDGKVHGHINTFCDKVRASCVFEWFLGIAFLGAMIMEFNLINLEGDNKSYVKSANGEFHNRSYDQHNSNMHQEEVGSFHNTFSYDADRGSTSSANSFSAQQGNNINTVDL